MHGRICIAALVTGILIISASRSEAHERETTSVTWARTISRIMIQRCGSCHRDGGSAFSLMTYDDARPWAVAIRDEVLARTMPPWGAVKGFGEFRNDQALSPAQTNLIVSWVEGGVPEGQDEDLPEVAEWAEEESAQIDLGAVLVSGPYVLEETFTLDGIFPREVPSAESIQIVAELPTGQVEPLLWLYEYSEAYPHPFLLKQPLELPAGTVIRGVPSDATVALLPPPASE